MRKRLIVFDKFWYYCGVRSVSSHRPSSSIDQCIKPRGIEVLDPTLPPSNKFQIVFEEKSATEFHIKDDPNLLTFPPTSILVTDFIASTQNHNIVVHDEMHPKSEEVFKQKNQAPQSDCIYRIDESIPKAQMGYVFPSTSSNARVTHSRKSYVLTQPPSTLSKAASN